MRPSLLIERWQLTPGLLLEAASCCALYSLGALRLGRRWPLRRTLSFVAGVGVALVALQSGVDAYSDRLLSVHMVQHMLLLLVGPALLLGGRPVLLMLRAVPPTTRRTLSRWLDRARPVTSPLTCLAVFSAVVMVTHLPSVFDLALRVPAVHLAEHAAYVTAGLLLWWPLVEADPAPRRRLGGLARLGYLIVAMVPMSIIGAYLNRDPALVYAPYGPPARSMGVSALTDQANAGAIMWVIGDVIMIAVGLWSAVAAMIAEERRQLARDARAGAMLAPGELAHPNPTSGQVPR